MDDVILAPSERVVVDVLFENPGELTLEHRTPERTYKLAHVTVTREPATPSLAEAFAVLRTDPELAAERERLAPLLDAPPDKTLAFVAEMDMPEPDVGAGEEIVYTCPMHPDVTSDAPDRCPQCGMKLLPAQLVSSAGGGHEHGHGEHEHGHGEHEHHHGGLGHSHEAAGGIEWEDDMVEVNRLTTPSNTRWRLVDRTDGTESRDVSWRFRVGDG